MPSDKFSRKRLHNLREAISEHGLDAFLIGNPSNVSYLANYKCSDSYILILGKEKFFLTDFRYVEEARSHIKGFNIIEIKGNLLPILKSITKARKIKKLGFESRNLTCFEYKKLNSALSGGAKLIHTEFIVEKLRAIKDAGEIAKIKSAVKITLDTFSLLKKIIKPGVSELDVSAEINRIIRIKGASACAFEVIVASGPNSSMPHAKVSRRIIRDNEPVLVDMGVEFCGYKSDLTRMYFLGKMPHKVLKATEVVFAAKEEAISKLTPGVPINEIDRAARIYIESFGWSDKFGHGLGHGVGLDVHEDPPINRKNTSYLKAGMVFTIEPAVYFPGKFGIRLEDMVVITKNGAEVFDGAINQ
ncbi:MAG: hypothetical protein COV72_00120 [Candidatus Omnitrophica bacterium CG11_big_fil_rev_8_21_14_0_20_42_13]|uniref:Xaa-Pro dipeptidase n=1 Tax=Candidatus Ghiorseimicrobium undicola TaxID=1974746 RepID=A0A2H0LZV1_9BACT|nr:MAG: hypothetical protein COV72_00120 [Candidatus Omnitrophica bacterium CG11_big_fil_rev_8_21_14_0_20_42_13]